MQIIIKTNSISNIKINIYIEINANNKIKLILKS